MTAMRLHRYPSPSGGVALGKMGCTNLFHRITARDYVQDGLVAMWDGIENAGWGTHDPNATEWTELINNIPAALSNNGAAYSWGDDCLIVPRETDTSTKYIFDFINTNLNTKLNSSASYTVEIVAQKTDDYTASQDQWLSSSNKYPFFFQSYRTNNTLSYYTNNNADVLNVSTSTANAFVAAMAVVNSVGKTVYLNGEFKASDSKPYTPTFSSIRITNRGGQKKRYCIRIYSRALTADEIAYNYAIDKARFDLP